MISRAGVNQLGRRGFAWAHAFREQSGLVYLLAAQAAFVLLGYVTNVFIARRLGPIETGRFGVVMSVLTWIEVLIIDGAPQALRRYIAMQPRSAGSIVTATLPPQLRLALVVFLLSFLSSPALAAVLRDPSYTSLFRIAFVDILLYGAYWYVNGILHGLRRFGHLFVMIGGYALSKTLMTVALVCMGFRADGALLANALASAVGAALGTLPFIRWKLGRDTWDSGMEFWHFSRWNLLYGLLTSLLPSLDLWLVRYFGNDHQAGMYTVATSVARVPYFLALAFMSFTLPSLAANLEGGNPQHEALRRSWRTIQASAWLTFVPLLVLVEIFARPLVLLLFGPAYLASVPILRILFLGTIFYSLLLLENTRVMAVRGMVPTIRAVVLTTVVTAVTVAYGARAAGGIGAATAFGLSMCFGYYLSRRI